MLSHAHSIRQAIAAILKKVEKQEARIKDFGVTTLFVMLLRQRTCLYTSRYIRLHKGTPATNKRFLGRLILDVSAHNRAARPVSPPPPASASRSAEEEGSRQSRRDDDRDAHRSRGRDFDRDGGVFVSSFC